MVVDDEGPRGGDVDAERKGIVAEAGRCGGLARSEVGCGWEVGDPNLPETLDEGLDIVAVVGNTGECEYSVSLTLDSLTSC